MDLDKKLLVEVLKGFPQSERDLRYILFKSYDSFQEVMIRCFIQKDVKLLINTFSWFHFSKRLCPSGKTPERLDKIIASIHSKFCQDIDLSPDEKTFIEAVKEAYLPPLKSVEEYL